MPFTHEIDHGGKTMRATVTGTVTLAEILKHLQEERRECGLSYAEIIDARNVTVAVATADVKVIVDTLRTLSEEQPLGLTPVVVSSDHAYGMVRMLGALVDDFCLIQAFRRLEEAEEWLRETTTDDGR